MNKTNTVIVFNGRPKSGKDTMADMLSLFFKTKYNTEVPVISNKTVLMRQAAMLLGMAYHEWCEYYEHAKDIELIKGTTITPRKFICKLAEEFIKPIFGSNFYGKEVEKYICNYENNDVNLFIVSDGGFKSEIEELVNSEDISEIIIIRINRDNIPDLSDTREDLSTIEHEKIHTYVVENNKKKEDCLNDILGILKEHHILSGNNMSILDAQVILKEFQEWRRGKDGTFATSPKELGIAIDTILEHLHSQ